MGTSGLRRILIVDDNAAIHDDFRKILGRATEGSALDDLEVELFAVEAVRSAPTLTYDISSAYQGEEAFRMVLAAREGTAAYAMAFVDMRMPPGWDGVETITKLWEADPDLQVVICTAYSDYSWEQILGKLGGSDRLLLLKKPFDTAEVCQLACALTEKWHLARHAHLKLTQLRSMVQEQTRDLALANVRLQESETRYALAATGANDGLWDWNLLDDTVFYSPRWKQMLGFSEDEVGDRSAEWFGRIHGDDQAFVAAIMEMPAERSHITAEYRIQHRDGQYRSMLCRGAIVRDAAGRPCRAAGSQTDITDRKMAEAQLRHDAFHDALTGLPNRAVLAQRLNHCIARLTNDPAFHFIVMFIDVDRFKVINDSLGHVVGDRLLVALSKRLSSCIRATDTLVASERTNLVRIGGDEFVLLLEGLRDDRDGIAVAERLFSSVVEPFAVDGHLLHVSLSMGIAVGKASYSAAEDVLRDADTALYRAKEEGRGCFRLFSDDLHASAMVRWQTETDLRRAITENHLRLQYQPIVDLETGALDSFEALVRWHHPARGLVPPSDFIPLAEETGLIVPLGQWVLDEACRQLARWRKASPQAARLAVAVNVACRQLIRPTFAAEVMATLEQAGLDPGALKIEVTESSTMDRAAVETCMRLRDLGVALHLDDFGTGYSSLSYLHRMPVHALKIDRSFTSTMRGIAANASIVQAIVALAKALRIECVAEGVESAAELDLLRQMGCSRGQGYLFARPLDASAASVYIESTLRRSAGPSPQIAPQIPLNAA